MEQGKTIKEIQAPIEDIALDAAAPSVEQPTAPKSNMAAPAPTGVFFLIICLIISLAAGAISGWAFARSNSLDVYVVDVKSIVEEKKRALVEGYKKTPTDETIAAADKDLGEFLVLLDKGITRMGASGGRIVLLKDAYLSGEASDMTETLSNQIKALQAKKSKE